jgi:hypothetical protein
MKYLLTIGCLTLLLQSCTIALPAMATTAAKADGTAYSHQEYMNKVTTKRQVVQKFGSPSSKERIEGLELWFYDKGTNSYAYTTGTANTNLKSNYNGRVDANTRASVGTRVNSYDKYVEFQFVNDKVVNWRSRGVDYGKIAPATKPLTAVGYLLDGFGGIFVMCWAVRNDPDLACW